MENTNLIKSKYLSADEFKEMTGIDLAIVLKDDFDPSTKVERFIINAEDTLETFAMNNYHKSIASFMNSKLTATQKIHIKKAIMYQVKYMLINGDIANDSGYDFDTGIKAKQSELYTRSVSRQAIDELRICGVASRNLNAWWECNFLDGGNYY